MHLVIYTIIRKLMIDDIARQKKDWQEKMPASFILIHLFADNHKSSDINHSLLPSFSSSPISEEENRFFFAPASPLVKSFLMTTDNAAIEYS